MTVTHVTFGPFIRPASPAHRVWTGLQDVLTLHRTRRMLAVMDDRMLADIGLSRAEAGFDADQSIWDAGLR